MKDWQLDLMIQNERDEAWEKLNASDPCEDALKEAAKVMGVAIGDLNGAIWNLICATKELNDSPVCDKVISALEELEEIECELKSMKDHWEKGERE